MAWSKDNSEDALLAADEALLQAKRAEVANEYIDEKKPLIDKFTGEQTNLQTQINDLVLQKGTDIAEVVQARGGEATLNERLNKTTAQLAETTHNIKPSHSVWEEFEQREVNVKWFGAKGNGIANDTIAIQNVISFLNSIGGGILFFPSGIYKVSKLNLFGNIIYRGSGKNATIIDGSLETSTPIFDIPTIQENITIEHIQFRNKTGATTHEGYGVRVKSASKNIVIQHCKFLNCSGGIDFFFNQILNELGKVTSFEDSSKCKALYNEFINTTKGFPIQLMRSDECIIEGNYIDTAPDHGIRMNGTKKSRVLNNTIKNCKNGISIQGYTDGETIIKSTDDFIVSHNTLVDCSEDGIEAFNLVVNGIINSNSIIYEKPAAGNPVGISIIHPANSLGGCENIEVTNNNIKGTNYGIKVSSINQKDIFVEYNNISNIRTMAVSAVAIDVQGSDEGIFINNNKITQRIIDTVVCIRVQGGTKTVYVMNNKLIKKATSPDFVASTPVQKGNKDSTGFEINSNIIINV